VIAGPNGAGKTTVTARRRAERCSEGVEYLNPDEIARDRFGDWNSPTAVLQAAEWTLHKGAKNSSRHVPESHSKR
jgi:predicted ABC-type ATPase